MSRLFATLYDPVLALSERACLGAWRRELLRAATGQVLEIGAGTGHNLTYFPGSVTSLILTEPNRAMRARLLSNLTGLENEPQVVADPAEHLGFDRDRFDCVVATFVLCSVSDLSRALTELRRVLRDDGQLLLLEHIPAPPNSATRRLQERLDPLWSRAAGGCHLNRDLMTALDVAGFAPAEIIHDQIAWAPTFLRHALRGRFSKR